MKNVFSGIQPSGTLHIGNYYGAIKRWVNIQDEADRSIFCIVDLHAITIPQEKKELQKNIISTAALYLASGIDPNKSSLFVQSTRPEHTELAWILNTIAKMGELERMTQYKDKSGANQESVSVGLFDYPVLMASDILLYNTSDVPVGDDQKQHIELTRNLAERFNKKFGETFVIPRPIIGKSSARIMGLDDPKIKMSKSATSSLNYIALSDSPEVIHKKIQKAVTDSGNEIKSSFDKPAISNLINIYSEASGDSVEVIEKKFVGKSYGEFKQKLADVIIDDIRPIQQKYNKIMTESKMIEDILLDGSKKIAPIAQKTLSDVKKRIGLGII